MAIVKYYADDSNYPYVQKAIMERIKLYYCQLLYPKEDYATVSNKRYIQASFDAGDDATVRKSIDAFKNTQGTFPFTAYNINENEIGEYYSHYQKNGTYYSSEYNSYVTYVPVNTTLDMCTFFTNASDYSRADLILNNDAICLTRLDVPITLNGVLTSFTIDLNMETTKGDLAFNVEQQFAVGKIYPLIHTTIIKGAYFILVNNFTVSGGSGTSGSSGGQQASIIRPVDDIILALKQLDDEKNLEQNPIIDIAHSPNTPVVLSSSPLEAEVDFDKDSPILITFNVSMDETYVINNIDVVPYFSYTHAFDTNSKVLVIDPIDSLQSTTPYYILINTKSKSSDGIYMEKDFELNFVTGN